MPSSDSAASLNWVEFAIAGCQNIAAGSSLDGSADAGARDGGVAEVCTGRAPLELRFTAVATAEITIYNWKFGDGQGSTESSPVKQYPMPGDYTVSLAVGGPGGTADVERIGAVRVVPAELGDRCTADGQCSDDRECVCSDGVPCRPGLERGLCSVECSASNPCASGVCADLAASNPSSPQDWQRSLCLFACADDSECPDELTCQEIPMAGGGGWVKGCFVPGALGAIGASCFDATGLPDHHACASGFCADVGARGACSAPCLSGSCPPSSACADFAGSLADLCLLRCRDETPCTADPWLACEAPGGAAEFDFTVDEPTWPDGYCAPKSCSQSIECGVGGSCTGGFCGR